MKCATLRRIERVGYFAFDRPTLCLGRPKLGHGVKEHARIGMKGTAEHFPRRGDLNDAAQIHDADSACHVADNREEFLNNFALKSKRSVAKARTEGPAAWIIANDGKRPALAAQLARLLQRQGAEIHRLDRETEVKVSKPAPPPARAAATSGSDAAPPPKTTGNEVGEFFSGMDYKDLQKKAPAPPPPGK